MRTALLVFLAVAVAVLGALVMLAVQGGDRAATGSPDTGDGPAFEVRVERPRANRPAFGLLPTALEDWLVEDRILGFDDASPGAEIGDVGPDRLELRADDWEFVVEADVDGRITEGTHLVFPITLANRDLTLRCRSGDGDAGSLRTARKTGADELDGRFLVELSRCENAATGRQIDWPASALTVRGVFRGLPPAVLERP